MNERQKLAPPSPTGSDAALLRIDPHVHTLASDGVDGAEVMIQAAIMAGLAAVAITDHDTLAGAQEMLLAGCGTSGRRADTISSP